MQTVGAAEARTDFAAFLQQVSGQGERILIEQHGRPKAILVPIDQGYIGPDLNLGRRASGSPLGSNGEGPERQATRRTKLGCWIWDEIRSRCIYCSDALAEMNGVTVDEYFERYAKLDGLLSEIHPEDRENYERTLAAAKREAAAYEIEFREIRPDGELRHLRECAEPVFDSEGRHVRTVGTLQDITGLRHAETELHESDQRFKDFADASSDWFWEMDERCRFSYFSDRFTAFTGLPKDALLGKARDETEISNVEPSVWRQHLADLAAHRSFRGFEHSRTLPDGREVWFSVNGKAIFDDKGNFKGYCGTGSDITERKRAERALKSSQADLERAQRLAKIGSWRWSVERNELISCSEEYARLHGVLPDEVHRLLAEQMERVIHPDDRERVEAEFKRFDEQGRNYETGYRIVRADGEVRHVFEIGEAIVDGAGRAVEQVGTVQDVTDFKRIEEELRQSREDLEQRVTERTAAFQEKSAQLQALLDHSPAIILLKDAEGRYLLANRMFEQVFATTNEAIQGKLPGQIHDEKRAAFSRAQDSEVLRTRQPCMIEESIEVQGRTGTFLTNKFPVLDAAQELIGIAAIATDITERKEAEEAVERERERLASAVEALDQGFVIFDDKGRMVLCNNTYRDLYGPSSDAWGPGSTLEEIARDTAKHGLGLKDESEIGSWVERRIERFKLQSGSFEQKLTGNRWIRVNDSQLPNGWTVGTRTDITDLKRVEEELRESERRYRELFEESPVAMLEENWVALKAFIDGLAEEGVTDFAKFFRDHPDRLGLAYDLPDRFGITQAAVALYRAQSKEELHAAMTQETADPDELSGFGEMIAAFHGGAAKFEYDAEEIACDNKPIITRIKAVIPPKYRDDWSRVLVTMEDITKRKRAEEQLRQAQKMEAVGQLTGGVAHDFNNLLAIISGNAEFLAAKSDLGDRRLQAIIRATKRGAELTQRLLAFSREQMLHPQALEINAMVGGMIELLGRTLGATIEIKTSSAALLWRALVDPGQLENALLNLAINARDAMPEGGVLAIEAFNISIDGSDTQPHADVGPGDYVVLAVSDSGHGMSPEILEHALEPFFTTKQTGEGSGLGLAMVYGFVMQSGGHVSIDSEEGRGTTVKLYLPRAHVKMPQAGGDQMPNPPRAKGESVLVVEDDDDVRELATEMLRDLGYRVRQAPDGLSALSILESAEAPDLMLSDVVLPRGLSGLELAERVRRERPATKILFMSGYSERSARRDSLTKKGALFLNKPFGQGELAVKLREVLGS